MHGRIAPPRLPYASLTCPGPAPDRTGEPVRQGPSGPRAAGRRPTGTSIADGSGPAAPPAGARPPRFRCPLPAALLALAAATCASAAASGDPAARCETAAADAARTVGVPAPLLDAIARAESGRAPRPGARPRPWPWTLNAGGIGRWFASEAEAREALEALLAQGRQDVDVGCFQINLRWHGAAYPDPAALLDPATSAQAAARFLRDLHAEAGDWRIAAARYHSRDPERGAAYVARLEAIHAARSAPTPVAETAGAAPEPAARITANPAAPGPLPGPLIDLQRRLRPLVGGDA